jgi:isopentenyl diphosphate isomerase/L-lactate dehydrogenase-like FMN-dependent dehydrogenase
LARNSRAFDALTLVPNYLVDVTQRSAATRVFGVDYAAPFGIGPTGLGNLIWPGTDEAIARAATEAGIPFCLSTPATTSRANCVYRAGRRLVPALRAARSRHDGGPDPPRRDGGRTQSSRHD